MLFHLSSPASAKYAAFGGRRDPRKKDAELSFLSEGTTTPNTPTGKYEITRGCKIFRHILCMESPTRPGIPKFQNSTNSTHPIGIADDPCDIHVQNRSRFFNTLKFNTIPSRKSAPTHGQGGMKGAEVGFWKVINLHEQLIIL